MKLVMAIVSSDDSRDALDRLTKAGFRATVISTTGGFLREGNTTLFLGTDEPEADPGGRDPAPGVPAAHAVGFAPADARGARPGDGRANRGQRRRRGALRAQRGAVHPALALRWAPGPLLPQITSRRSRRSTATTPRSGIESSMLSGSSPASSRPTTSSNSGPRSSPVSSAILRMKRASDFGSFSSRPDIASSAPAVRFGRRAGSPSERTTATREMTRVRCCAAAARADRPRGFRASAKERQSRLTRRLQS